MIKSTGFFRTRFGVKGQFPGNPDRLSDSRGAVSPATSSIYSHRPHLSDCYSFIRKWLRELVSTQYDDGCLKGIAPDPSKRTMFDGSSGWLNAMVIVPDKIEKYYGDCELYQEFYDAMKKTVLFQLNRAKSKTRSHNLNNPFMNICTTIMSIGENGWNRTPVP